MENQNIILDGDFGQEVFSETDSNIENQNIIDLGQFIILNILTLGLYQIWWTYKSWSFYKQKERSDISPVARAIFGIFFLHSLFTKNLSFAKSKGYNGDYSSTMLFILVIITSISGQLPAPYNLISIIGFLFIIPPFLALNYAIKQSPEIKSTIQKGFNTRQIVLIIIGLIVWGLVLIGLTQI